jgi:hypothetical protein
VIQHYVRKAETPGPSGEIADVVVWDGSDEARADLASLGVYVHTIDSADGPVDGYLCARRRLNGEMFQSRQRIPLDHAVMVRPVNGGTFTIDLDRLHAAWEPV